MARRGEEIAAKDRLHDWIMLEQRMLLLRPRTSSAVRIIADGETDVVLGFARWESPTPPRWRHLFARRVLSVHEQEDEPLLFTVRRAWSLLPRREVRDAENHPIGSLLGRLVHDRDGRAVAALHDDGFHDPRRRVLADLTTHTDGLRLAFHADIAGEPFLKMLLLAAALVFI